MDWFVQIVLGLAKIHSLGIVHRDIKPMNILLAGQNEFSVAKLGDFGSAKELDRDSSPHTLDAGTTLFYSPERFFQQLSAKADIWALGVSMYYLLSNGEYPFNDLMTIITGSHKPLPLTI